MRVCNPLRPCPPLFRQALHWSVTEFLPTLRRMPPSPRILTNMTFWQSPRWLQAVDCIDDIFPQGPDPRPHSSFRQAVMLWRRAGDYDVILTEGARESLLYGILCLLTRRPSRQVMTEVFIDAPRSHRLLWRVKTALFRLIAQRSQGILTNSSTELDTIARRFALSPNRLRYVPLNTTLPGATISTRDDGFILTAGRTLRDYPTLLEAASLLEARLVVVCGKDDLVQSALPKSFTVHREISRARYLELLDACSLVALPLLDTERSTGQVVVLEAMSIGKPVVATDAPGTRDLIVDGTTGRLVPSGNATALAKAINALLSDSDLRQSIATRAHEIVHTQFSVDTHTEAKLKAIRSLWQPEAD